MAFKLIEAAQQRGLSANAPHLVAVVRAGAKFETGGDDRASQRAGSGSRRVISGRTASLEIGRIVAERTLERL